MRWAKVIAVAGFTGQLWGQRVGSPTGELDKLGVEELFGIQVTSVGRKAERLSKAPAAIFVLTSEDIRRSGASSIPEALRLVPGMTVLRLDGRSWVISARGSARLYSDKILVMLDGRSLYNQLFSGVIWDSVDVMLEDVERIEIVRGPGAVMWGPNAVNGVINIITKRAQATKGELVAVNAGNEQRGVAVRAGFAPNDRVAYRVWGKGDYQTPAYGSPGYFRMLDQFIYRDPAIENLDFGTTRAGFRVDGGSGKYGTWMVQGDAYKNNRQDPNAFGTLLPSVVTRSQGHSDYEGGFIQGSWTRSASESEETALQFSYTRNDIDYPFASLRLHNATIDVQRRSSIGERHELYWGGGYQQYGDSIGSRYYAAFNPGSAVYRVADLVVRDEWQLVPQRLMASGGVRMDYRVEGGIEYQPSFRLAYTPNPKESAWLAASRAIRAPSRFDRDINVQNGLFETPLGIPLEARFIGSKNMRSEVERSLEAGYRRQSGQRWSVDVSGFWSRYERLRAIEGPAIPRLAFVGGVPILQQHMLATNAGSGRSYGGEAWAYWQVSPTWRLTPEYSYLNETRWLPQSDINQYAWDWRPTTIGHQGVLRSQHDLTKDIQFDIAIRARSANETWKLSGAVLADARLAWRAIRGTEVSVSAQNLTGRKVLECYPEGPTPAIPIRRTVSVKWSMRF